MATAMQDFGAELLFYGGVPTPRREVIAHLKECGFDDQCVDRYLQGLEHAEVNGLGLCGHPVATDAEGSWEPAVPR